MKKIQVRDGAWIIAWINPYDVNDDDPQICLRVEERDGISATAWLSRNDLRALSEILN